MYLTDSFSIHLDLVTLTIHGRGQVIGIATPYGLGGPEFEPRSGQRDFLFAKTCSDRPGAQQAFFNGYCGTTRVQGCWGVALATHSWRTK
jgi:hypothetical protein